MHKYSLSWECGVHRFDVLGRSFEPRHLPRCTTFHTLFLILVCKLAFVFLYFVLVALVVVGSLLPENCDASELLPNAADLGDCTSSLPSGDSCRNTGISGYSCTVSICNDGVLSPGNCVEGVSYAIGPVQSSCDGNNLGTVHTGRMRVGSMPSIKC